MTDVTYNLIQIALIAGMVGSAGILLIGIGILRGELSADYRSRRRVRRNWSNYRRAYRRAIASR
jgi:hypothetical protein